MTANARVVKICAGCYEWHGDRVTFTITRDRNDAGKTAWFIREGGFPGGPAFDVYDAFREAVGSCPHADENDGK